MWRLLVAVFVLQVVTTLGADLDARARNKRAIIVGGDDASVDNFPYQVSLRIFNEHACGASVIGKSWALSAAHCCVDFQPNFFSLRAGSSRSDIGGAVYAVRQIVVHELYDKITMDYDICAIQPAKPFQLSSVIKPIPLDPINLAIPSKAFVLITGWGRVENRPGGAGSRQLQSALVKMFDHAACVQIYSSLGTVTYVTERQICAGADSSGRDACQGDSGGPMAYNGRLVGVVSWGIGCGDRRYPGIYTSVAAMRGWIHATTGI